MCCTADLRAEASIGDFHAPSHLHHPRGLPSYRPRLDRRRSIEVAIDLEPAFAKIAQGRAGCVAGVRAPGRARPDCRPRTFQSGTRRPLTADSIIETGSLAKQFTAAAIMLLVEDGKASLDDDIQRYLPEMPDYGVPITLRHLLNHTSGLREQWSLLALTGNGPGARCTACL